MTNAEKARKANERKNRHDETKKAVKAMKWYQSKAEKKIMRKADKGKNKVKLRVPKRVNYFSAKELLLKDGFSINHYKNHHIIVMW